MVFYLIYNMSYRHQKGGKLMNEKRFTLRMDAELFELIKQTAEKNKRSTAKEIEFILEDFLKRNKLLPDNQKE